MEPIYSIPPEKGVRFSKVYWPTHRINAKLEDLTLYHDYEIVADDYIKYYPSNNVEGAVGASCFVPLGDPNHNSPVSKEAPCYYLSQGTYLPSKLALVYTHEMKLRFPKKNKKGWHFIIVATEQMTKDEYIRAVKDLDWQVCNIKAAAYPDPLVRAKEDLEGVKDFRIIELYWLMFNLCINGMNYTDHFYANDIHTWIALDHPSFEEFLQHKARACFVFSILARMDISSVTLETYKFDILNELEDTFGWDVEKFLTDYKDQKAKLTSLYRIDSGVSEIEKSC
ncbi:unnamed protein product [Rhizophagus irregularis]|uniref:Uncharacterized protein n=1 Tax=Rhizophagus irregularis TaxID=588596 RepID=A0A2N1N568_9GLOM|nr:hypothetical protein RhiirC2_712939 [Rhizophagus irregularis]CAB4399496.1 unnamed protein product [Rhizophagus irregularis]CAB5367636.1 unnamed protein product [Rhizophagus irregularis]